MKTIFAFIFLALLLPSVLAGTVTRDFQTTVEQGEQIIIDLDVVTNGASTYSVSEFVPNGWTIIDSGTGVEQSSGNEIRWFVLGSAVDTTLQYTIQAPASSGVDTSYAV